MFNFRQFFGHLFSLNHGLIREMIKHPLLILLFCFAQVASATHIVGGFIHYEQTGQNEYRIKVKIYLDCFNGISGFDDPASIGVFDNNGDLIQNILIDLSDAEIIELPVILENNCYVAPGNVCVEECTYDKIVQIDVPAGGLTLTYQRCCRNSSIVNTASNDDIGMTVTAFIPGPEVATWNSNPEYVSYPPIFICLNNPFEMDHSAIDADGDELVYSFCNPLLTNVAGNYINPPGPPPYPEMPFYPEYNAAYPIASDPAFTIDPNTGFMTGTPNLLGQFVVGVCVEEYRNGVLISSTNRDFQFNVTICQPDPSDAVPIVFDQCAGTTISFENESSNAISYHWDFGVEDALEDTSNLANPTFVFPEPGIYDVTLIVNPGLDCADTAVVSVNSFDTPDVSLFVGDYACINDVDHYSFQVQGEVLDNLEVLWEFPIGSDPLFSTSVNAGIVSMNAGLLDYEISLTVSSNGCEIVLDTVILNPPDPIAVINPQEAFCDGFTYTFSQSCVNTTEYLWEFGDPFFDDQSSLASPTYTFSGEGEYTISLTASAANTCPHTSWMNFEIFGSLEPFFETPDAQCLEGNSFDFFAEGSSSNNPNVNWDFPDEANISFSNELSPQNIHFDTNGWHVIALTTEENGCIETYIDSIRIYRNFENTFSIDTTLSCPPVEVHCFAESIADSPVFYYWEFGDGTFSSDNDPLHVYYNGQNYDISVTAYTLSGCVEEETVVFPDAISVLPHPVAGFIVNPQILDISNPEIHVQDASQGAIECQYVLSDGSSYEAWEFYHTWQLTGLQNITQYVTNENGCTASVSGEIMINGFALFVPNSFTPDDDGLNDFWKPVITGVSSYRLQIFNRWGDLIFETNDPERPWLGEVHDGDYHAQNEVYQYRIVAEDLMALPHDVSGHITIIR
jgi:gliding motility-associated-like protein